MNYLNEIIILSVFVTCIGSFYFIKKSRQRKLLKVIEQEGTQGDLRQCLIHIYQLLKIKDPSKELYSLKVLMRDKKNKALCVQIQALQHALIGGSKFNPDLLMVELKKFKKN
ncbi:hypothetical protein PQO03_10815 [Lentisphaera profundi]|uniref:Uncharacterized protein n=1 Tax=Lentisphaera profundi TaxID=1658616 RepID=A0ABY7VPV1_9BACT|nr:hypothetical protein [Lentisphaera profundi]WDE96200.1 hypothetical protein PQO03_10815 [Lentisphaera profundi]